MGDIRTVECDYFNDRELEILYEHRDFLEKHFNSVSLTKFLYTLSGGKPLYFDALALAEPIEGKEQDIEEVEPFNREYFKFNSNSVKTLTDMLDELGATYVYRIDYKDSDKLENHREGFVHVMITTQDDLLTEEDEDNFYRDELSHRRIGELLGYPESAIDSFIEGQEISREEKADLYYEAIEDLGVDGLPHITMEEQIPIVYLKSIFSPTANLSDDIEDYKWSIKYYLELFEFASTMSDVLNSKHINNWNRLSHHNYATINPDIETTAIIENFRDLQEKYVVNNDE